MARKASSTAWSSRTTQEMLSSEEPCAMAMTLTPTQPRAPKRRPATPGVPRMPPPTAVTMATQRPRGGSYLAPRDDHGDVALAGGLRDHEHVHPGGGQGPKAAPRDARHAEHAQALDRDQRQVADRRHRFDRAGPQCAGRGDERAGMSGVEGILDAQRHARGHGRHDRAGMDHFGP